MNHPIYGVFETNQKVFISLTSDLDVKMFDCLLKRFAKDKTFVK